VRRQAVGQGPWALVISQSKILTCGYGGALGGTRTPSLLIRSQMLYPLSYERSPCSILHFGPSRCVLETRARRYSGNRASDFLILNKLKA
jgi:hypothetical protein